MLWIGLLILIIGFLGICIGLIIATKSNKRKYWIIFVVFSYVMVVGGIYYISWVQNSL